MTYIRVFEKNKRPLDEKDEVETALLCVKLHRNKVVSYDIFYSTEFDKYLNFNFSMILRFFNLFYRSLWTKLMRTLTDILLIVFMCAQAFYVNLEKKVPNL